MARKTQAQADARQRKQKIIVAVGGVVLVALLAIQGPKLMNRGSSAASTTSESTSASTTSESTSAKTPSTAAGSETTVAATPVVRTVKAPKSQTARLAGVVIVPEQPVAAGEGQLNSFSLFTTKDPFVQQIKKDDLPTPGQVAAAGRQPAPAAPKPAPAAPPTGGGSTAGASTGTAAGTGTGPGTVAPSGPSLPAVGSGRQLPLPAPTMALLRVNGKVQAVGLKKRFPASDKAFVLRSLKRDGATIAVAGGSFAGGTPTLTLRFGRAVTLVNTATGVRYVLRLIYVGADAAQVTGFSQR